MGGRSHAETVRVRVLGIGSSPSLHYQGQVVQQIRISQQTLVCLLGQFDKRFFQRSSTILALAHDALTERQGLPCPTMMHIYSIIWMVEYPPRPINRRWAR